jgi:hypothetical protein
MSSTSSDFPKTDISGQMSGKLLADIGSKDWKTRKAAADTIKGAIRQAFNSISGNGLNDLFKALKPRTKDCNRTLTKKYVKLIGLLGEALEGDARRYATTIIPEVIKCLAEKTS